MTAILLILVVALGVILSMVLKAPSIILFIPTPPNELGDNGEVSEECTQHYHSFWHWVREKDQWIPRLEHMTHFWECTTETCPNDGAECERPKPHQKWGVGPKIHDKSL